MKRCWICHRTEKEVRNKKVVEWDENKLIKQDSVAWTHMPYVCNVCIEIIRTFMVDEGVTYDCDLEQDVKEIINKSTINLE
jgi:hypothetical protein